MTESRRSVEPEVLSEPPIVGEVVADQNRRRSTALVPESDVDADVTQQSPSAMPS